MLPGGAIPQFKDVPEAPETYKRDMSKQEFKKANRQMRDRGFHKEAWVKYETEKLSNRVSNKIAGPKAGADAAKVVADFTGNLADYAAGLR